MHQREVLAAGGATVSDTLHLVITGIGVFTFLVVIACAMSAFGRRFRIYSVATITAMLVFGTLTSLYAAEVESNQPTPGVGLYERINAHGYALGRRIRRHAHAPRKQHATGNHSALAAAPHLGVKRHIPCFFSIVSF
jgi:hypothetical protein